MLESAATTFASLFVLGLVETESKTHFENFTDYLHTTRLAGYTYHRYYKYLILRKMSKAFEPGDPVLELAALRKAFLIPYSKAMTSIGFVMLSKQR